MNAQETQKNHWLEGAPGSIQKIMDMLVELDNRNLVPVDMRAGLVRHAEELTNLIPNYIAANANMMAQAHAEKSVSCDGDMAAQACWGIAFMTEALSGLQYLARLESDRQKYPDIQTAVSKAYGANIKPIDGA